MQLISRLIYTAFLALIFFQPVTAQVENHSFTLFGKVTTPSGEPLAGVSVYLHETHKGSFTDADGRFSLSRIRPGFYHLHITYVGFQSLSVDLDLRDSVYHWSEAAVHEIRKDFILKPTRIELKEAIIESNPLKLSKAESPVDMQVIGQDEIIENAGFTLMRSLERLPGINAFNTGIGISKPIIRGMGFNRVAVSDNGIKQEGQQWGADHGLEIDQYNVDRVEILKGPASLVYGSEAIGGVLKIKQILPSRYGERNGSVLLNYRGVNNTYGSSALYEGNDSGFVYRVRVTALDYGDFSIPADSFSYNRWVLPLHSQKAKNTAGQELHGAFTAGVNRSWGFVHATLSNYHQKIGIFSGATGIPRAYNLQPDGDERNIDLPFQQINHLKGIVNANLITKGGWLEIDGGYQQNLRDEHSAPHAHGYDETPQGSLAHRLNLQTISLNSRYHLSQGLGSSYILGFTSHYQWNRISGYEFILPDFNFGNAGVFILNKRSIGQKLHITWGGRLDAARITAQERMQPVPFFPDSLIMRSPALDRWFGNWSASAGLAYQASEAWNLKFNVGRYFRIPTPQELTANGIHHGTFRHEQGDTALNPETGFQIDLGVEWVQQELHFAFTPFFNYFNNHIYLSPTGRFSTLPEGGQVYRFTNAEALMAGAEFTAEWHLLKELHLAAGLEYVYAQNLSKGIPLPFIPPGSARFEAAYSILVKNQKNLKSLKLNTMFSMFAAQNRTDRNEPATPAYQLWDAGFSLFFGKKWMNAQLMLSVQNLLNTPYLNHLSRWRLINLPEPGRNVNASLILPVLKK